MSGGSANKIAKPTAPPGLEEPVQRLPPGLEDIRPQPDQNRSSSAQEQVSANSEQRSTSQKQSNQRASPKQGTQQQSPQRTNKQPSSSREGHGDFGQTVGQSGSRGPPQQRPRQQGSQAQQSPQSSARFQQPRPPGLQSSSRPPHANQMPTQQINISASLGRQPSPQQSQQSQMQQMQGLSTQLARNNPYGARSPVGSESMHQGGFPGTSDWYAPRGDPSNHLGLPPHMRMPEQPMLPSPGLPTGPGMPPMMGPSVPQQQSVRQGAYSRHFADAVNGSLQKFSHAAALQKAAEQRGYSYEMPYGHTRSSSFMKSYGSTPMMPMASETRYDHVDSEQRVQAQQQAEATAARLAAKAAAGASKSSSATQAKENETSASGDNDEKRYQGRIRSFNVGQGFGFIESVEVAKIHGCDVFLNQAVEGGVVVGSTVSFTVELNKNGKPQARRVVLEDVSTAKPPPSNKPHQELGSMVRGIQHQSKVKSFNTSRGFGFLATPADLQYSFGGRDIYVSKNQVPEGGLFVGQEVQFKLVVDTQGQPQARDLRVISKSRGLDLPYTGLPFS